MVVMCGPEAGRFVYTQAGDRLRWRCEGDAITRLLGQGLLVIDGAQHDELRKIMEPALRPSQLPDYLPAMLRYTEAETDSWRHGDVVDMAEAVRCIAILIVTDTLFGVDISSELDRLWKPILAAVSFIGPGAWLLWQGMPRPRYRRPLADLDAWLYGMIDDRRRDGGNPDDILGRLLAVPGLSDAVIRDQLLTMIIAGHDTSASLLAWTMWLLGRHPEIQVQAQAEIDAVLGNGSITPEKLRQLRFVDQIVKEALRLYPPAHTSQRRVSGEPIQFNDYTLTASDRLMHSIYLSQRHSDHWSHPDDFQPERWSPGQPKPEAFTYTPFGGGPRTCVGAAYGAFEAQAILARLLQEFQFELPDPTVHMHMGAAIEPRPGVFMRVHRRTFDR